MYHVGAREYDPRTARWLQRDPIDAASGDPNLYRYCGNDSVNGVDPSGAKQPCIKTIIFTGDKLKFYDETGRQVETVTAYSGMPGATPADQSKQDYGPIPEGTYWIDPRQVQTATPNPFKWRSPEYYPPSDSWGNYRVPLQPDKNTNTFGRSGFFLHGSSEWNDYGSAGCIDVGTNDEVIARLIQQRGCRKVKVVVKYVNRNVRVPTPLRSLPRMSVPQDPRLRYYP